MVFIKVIKRLFSAFFMCVIRVANNLKTINKFTQNIILVIFTKILSIHIKYIARLIMYLVLSLYFPSLYLYCYFCFPNPFKIVVLYLFVIKNSCKQGFTIV
ncbi:hypothetical protein PARC_a2649 [Pseudoalteromonas arctica A 37-1-2]|uniref:Uncharacterized protein n=1 Tax=Pseudoalteromonas arctica A 37-1-2 TaxID=1117313 RepID=A0A290S4X1_9GAMM|nr:hypothetical protein PARC_a2649 [Pseudoalteromonas arctica A 37-1-2]